MFKKAGEINIESENPPSFVYLGYSSETETGAVSTSDRFVYIFDSNTAQVITKFKAHNADISGLFLGESGGIIATCCEEGEKGTGNEVSLWDSKTGNSICTFGSTSYVHYIERCHCVAMNKKSTILAAGTSNGVLTWDVRKPEGVFKHINIQPDEISSIEFNPFANSTFLSGDDDGNLLMYDLDSVLEDDATIFYSNDNHPVFQCGFCGVDVVFTLRRTAGIRLWNIFDPTKDVYYEDLRAETNQSFNYPIDAHWCGEHVMVVGGDGDGGVALILSSQTSVVLHSRIKKAHRDCINASYLDAREDGSMKLLLAGDDGQMSFWTHS